jgi:polyisoprenoid-binding protein YceI
MLLPSLALALFTLPAWPHEWQIDPTKSTAGFTVKHMMVNTVRGQFGKLTGTVRYDPKNPLAASVQASVDAATVDTQNAKRDTHLRSADFFDVEKFPTLTFRSTKAEPAGAGKLKLTGDLTMHGVTKTVTFDVEGLNQHKKTAKAQISRREFGMLWNKLVETGGVVVSDEVQIILDVELVPQTR